jgi:DNA-binding protein Fis
LSGAVDLLVEEALRRAQGNQTIAARLLGISQPALSKRLKAGKR